MGATRTKDAVAAARGTANGRRNLIFIIAVAVIAAAVIGGVVYTHALADEPQAGGAYATTVQSDGTVVAGSATAKATLDVYEDFLCPYCEHNLEIPYGKAVTKAIADGSLRVKYHLLDLLDNQSVPAGYSMRAANAALAAAKAGRFAEFHAALYDAQPTEGQAGYTDEQLVDIGHKAGITGGQFATDVKAGTFDSEIKSQTDAAQNSVNFKGTPTVLSGDSQVDISKPGWLSQLTGAA